VAGRSPSTLRLAVLISGAGTTLRNLVVQIAAGKLDAHIALVLSSTAEAGGLKIARKAGLPVAVVDPYHFSSVSDFSQAVFDACRAVSPDLVAMGGFLKFVEIPPDFALRVVNIHPALIPAFCGKGLYGLRVHRAALDYGVKVSGCTVHFVDNQYDHGPIILQRVVNVADDDTPQSLAERVFKVECEAYPEALRLIAAGRVVVQGRRVRILEA